MTVTQVPAATSGPREHNVTVSSGGRRGVVGPAPPGPDARRPATRRRERYGGVKIGAAFLGWLAAVGAVVLVTASIVGAAAAVEPVRGVDLVSTVRAVAEKSQAVGVLGTIGLLLLVLFVAHYVGGYVAGRMARFDGVRQGLAVWSWAIFVALAVVLGWALAGRTPDVLSWFNRLSLLSPNREDPVTGGITIAIALAVAALAGAILGGIAGMRYHRRVDRVSATGP